MHHIATFTRNISNYSRTTWSLVSSVIFWGLAALPGSALAQDKVIGAPVDWQLHFQEVSSPVMRNIVSTHDLLLGFMTLVVLLVLGLLVYILVKFNEDTNPTPSKTTHNTFLEVVWTAVPLLSLIVLGFLTLPYIIIDSKIPKSDVVIKAIGNQWYWTFEYPEEDGISFDSVLDAEHFSEATDGKIRLLSVDNEIVVPVNAVVEIDVTSNDVLHALALPALGIKTDAVPGRVNKTWFKAEKMGWFYGQCSELCGGRHAFMPIAVRVVSNKDYQAWLVGAKEKFASNTNPALSNSEDRVTARSLDADENKNALINNVKFAQKSNLTSLSPTIN